MHLSREVLPLILSKYCSFYLAGISSQLCVALSSLAKLMA